MRLLTILTALVAALCMQARTVTDFFVLPDADAAIPLLDANTRMDMVDYYTSGIKRPSDNAAGGQVRITALDSLQLSYASENGSSMTVSLLPTPTDTLLLCIETLPLPLPDSRITVYGKNWDRTDTRILQPTVLADWLTAYGRKNRTEVEKAIPFIIADASYSPATKTLTLTHNMLQYISPEADGAMLRQALRPQLVYVFNGKRFNLQP